MNGRAINHLLYAKMLSKVSYRLLWNISCWRKKPYNRQIWTPLHNVVLCIWVLLTPGLQLTLVDTKQNIKTYHGCIAYSFLFEGCFCFPICLCSPKHVKFDQNFVTKKPKQKITWLVPRYGNKCLQNFSCQMNRQG